MLKKYIDLLMTSLVLLALGAASTERHVPTTLHTAVAPPTAAVPHAVAAPHAAAVPYAAASHASRGAHAPSGPRALPGAQQSCDAMLDKYCSKRGPSGERSACIARAQKLLPKRCQRYVSKLQSSAQTVRQVVPVPVVAKVPAKVELKPDAPVRKAEAHTPAPVVQKRPEPESSNWLFYTVCFGVVLMSGVMSFFFKKIGLNPIAGAIPFYNIYLLLIEIDRPDLWNLYLYIPIANLYFGYFVALDLVRRFGKSDHLAIALLIVPFIVLPYLSFGPDEYQANYGQEESDFGPDFSIRELSGIMATRIKDGNGNEPRKNRGTRDVQSPKEKSLLDEVKTIDIGIADTKT